MSQPATEFLDIEPPPPHRRRPWRHKFGNALRGLKLGIRGHSSFFVQFFFAALALAAAGVLRCELWEWCMLIVGIGMLMTAELFNSALETLYRGLDEATRERSSQALDVAAGAVLLATVTAALLGIVVFVHRLIEILG